MTATKPLLLLDVDGPLNPFQLITRTGHRPVTDPAGEPFVYQRHHLYPTGWADGLPVLLSTGHGQALRRLAEVYTLVWATTWEHEANSIIAPLVGLPELPVIEWPDAARGWVLDQPPHHGSWKTRHIAAWLDAHATGPDGRALPWVWVDDDVNRFDRSWLAEHYGQSAPPHRLYRVEPRHGLRAHDFEDLTGWGLAHRTPEE